MATDEKSSEPNDLQDQPSSEHAPSPPRQSISGRDVQTITNVFSGPVHGSSFSLQRDRARPASRPDVDWETCESEAECTGVRWRQRESCLAHLYASELESALEEISQIEVLDVRGVTFAGDLLRKLMAAFPRSGNRRLLPDARFEMATFKGRAWFEEVVFKEVHFDRAIFEGWAKFNGAIFENRASFVDAIFRGVVELEEATFRKSASFERVTFERVRQLGPLLAYDAFHLDGATFMQRPHVEVIARTLSCTGTRFLDGVNLWVSWAKILLNDATFGGPSIVAGALEDVENLPSDHEVRTSANTVSGPARLNPSQPWLATLERADVGQLTVSNVDLQACRFSGAHNLDKVRIEGALFSVSPSTLRWHRLPIVTIKPTRRQVIAEECNWQHLRKVWSGWTKPWPRLVGLAGPNAPLAPADIAVIYRALRKGREDNKDEPGAADFYYGEMEMRRHAKNRRDEQTRRTSSSVERAILTMYWLFAGYGLRAWRAFVGLGIIVTLAALVFCTVGFEKPKEQTAVISGVTAGGQPIYSMESNPSHTVISRAVKAFAFSIESSISVLRPPERSLTTIGEWTQIGLRITGPVLLGLAIISIRGRVKR
jgi:uncharacterized protein YjbI with pentapeptide repeats